MRNIFKKGSLYSRLLRHSAEGTTWKKHRYVKVVDDKYYYPDDYEGGRHISSLKSKTSSHIDTNPNVGTERKIRRSASTAKTYTTTNAGPAESSSFAEKTSSDSVTNADIEELARDVIRGKYGNGQDRRKALGELYEMVQSRVNELMGGSTGSEKISQISQNVLNDSNSIVNKSVNSPTVYRRVR